MCGSDSRGCDTAYLTCDFDVNRTATENVCRPDNLPAGSSCVIDAQCVGGDCTNGVCQGDDTGTPCFDSNRCNPPNKCVYVDQSTVSRQCLTQRATGGWCAQNADCVSNLCLNNACAERGATPDGGNCTLSAECESGACGTFPDGSFSPNGVCLEAARIRAFGEGSPCPGGSQECAFGHRCTGTDFDRVCKYVVGQQCGNSADCGNGFCSCDSFSQVCQAFTPSPPSVCSDEQLALEAAWGFATLQKAWHLYPADAQTKVAAYYCCRYRNGESVFSASSSYPQVVQGYQLDCSADPPTVVARDAVTYPERCSLTDVVPVENLIVGVPAAVSVDSGGSAAIDLPGRSASAHLSPLSLALSLGIALLVALLV